MRNKMKSVLISKSTLNKTKNSGYKRRFPIRIASEVCLAFAILIQLQLNKNKRKRICYDI